jgi:hypothetical protein
LVVGVWGGRNDGSPRPPQPAVPSRPVTPVRPDNNKRRRRGVDVTG